jgi:N-acetylglucosaminyl-diphospho-decaprenol L-rhamnosyltransferase
MPRLQQSGPDGAPKVSIIVVTYGSANEIQSCLESLSKQSVPYEIFLVDNRSPDNTAQIIAEYEKHYQNIHAILNEENIGLAAANNCALGKCHGDYVLILNPDARFRGDSLRAMVDYLDQHPDVGVVGPKNVYADGRPHTSFHHHWGLLHVLLWRVAPQRLPRTLYDNFSSFELQDVLFVSGACLLIRRSIFEQIGGYDPEYFLTVEDACDLCIRARKTGFRAVFFPDAEVLHITGRSGAQVPYLVVWQGIRGTVYHFLKHKGLFQALLVSLLLLLSCVTRTVLSAFFGLASRRYRNFARIYGRVCWNLVIQNPIRESALLGNSVLSPRTRS